MGVVVDGDKSLAAVGSCRIAVFRLCNGDGWASSSLWTITTSINASVVEEEEEESVCESGWGWGWCLSSSCSSVFPSLGGRRRAVSSSRWSHKGKWYDEPFAPSAPCGGWGAAWRAFPHHGQPHRRGRRAASSSPFSSLFSLASGAGEECHRRSFPAVWECGSDTACPPRRTSSTTFFLVVVVSGGGFASASPPPP